MYPGANGLLDKNTIATFDLAPQPVDLEIGLRAISSIPTSTAARSAGSSSPLGTPRRRRLPALTPPMVQPR
jgi:hypothetical protein